MDVVATTTKHTARSVKTEDATEVGSLFKLCNQEGLPLTASGWCERMVARRNTKNYFTDLLLIVRLIRVKL